MNYKVKEIYYTLQGEGANAGRAAVFCRFAACNLWNGLEESRESAKCYFCDTNFVGTDGPGGGSFRNEKQLALAIEDIWNKNQFTHDSAKTSYTFPFVVFTGGEPLLQLDVPLITAVKEAGFMIAVESNGTIAAPSGIDWLTISPKPNSQLAQRSGNELKLVFPQEIQPHTVADLDFKYFFLSPMEVADLTKRHENIQLAINYCMAHPQWRLTLQYHKILGIP